MRPFLIAGLLAISPAYAQSVLIVDPDPGASPVSTPQSLNYALGDVLATTTGQNGVRLSTQGSVTPRWSLALRSPGGAPLVAGCYERAKRFANQGRPEIDFSFNSQGCNNAFGRYKILEIQRDMGGAVTAIAVDFVQQCERYGTAVSGKLRYNSSVATAGPHHSSVTDQTGSLAFTAAAGAIGSTAPGGAATFQLSRQNLAGEGNPDNGASFRYSGALPGGGTGNWSLHFAAPGDQAITNGNYPNATRYPFQAATAPGLDFSYAGAGCNTLEGSFVVTNVVMDGLDNFPITFDAGFQQRCPNQSGPLTSGTIVFDANIIGPTEVPSPELLLASGFEDSESQPVSFYSETCD